ncbi:MAG: HlyD family efflux transporter periplasmic adaptor subunit [Chloroflexi bacterium]|nr:HlyD family efflux transporter periplasmic adaptor subunit [Chloroflexota bacterium]
MRRTTTALLLLAISIGVLLAGCTSKATPAPTASNQTAMVQKGNLRIEITTSGNLAFSQTEDLAFEAAGTAADVTVEVGDTVKKGQVLATLDKTAWQDNLTTLERQMTAAQRTLTAKERALAQAERQVATREMAVRQAELDVQTAENNLGKISEVKAAQDKVDDIEFALKYAQTAWVTDIAYWSGRIEFLKISLAEAKQNLREVLAGSSPAVSADVALQVARSQFQVEQSQKQLNDARIAIEDAKSAVVDAQLAKADAEQTVSDAQKALDEARKASPEIVATFDSIITAVSVNGGQAVRKGTVAVTIADPTKFEANVLVNENDIFNVKVGTTATVQPSALSTVSFPATVTKIAPTATVQQGVVNYKTTVELTALPAARSQMQDRQTAQPETSQGVLPDAIRQAVEAGRMTTEQAEALMRQRQAGQPASGGPGQFQGRSPSGGQPGQTGQGAASQAASTIQLRAGLTVTVNILVNSKTGVLLVPSRAIARQGTSRTVKVIKADGATETRTVQVGINDSQNTEVTSGLSEGEKVLVAQSTGSTSTQSTPRPGQPQFFGPGRGLIR